MLAAGEGRRLIPLTLAQAKPTMPVLGRPLAVQILHRLGRFGIEEAVVNLHHQGESIKAAIAECVVPGLPQVRFSHEEVLLGTAGGLRRAAPLLCDGDPVVVCNADFLSDIDLRAALEAHRRSGRPVTLVLAPARSGYSIVHADAEGCVRSLAGQPPLPADLDVGEYLFTGFQILDESVLAALPEHTPSDIVRDVYRGMCAGGEVGCHVHSGFWWEFGSLDSYLEGSLRLLDCPAERLRDISGDHDALRHLDGLVLAAGPGSEIESGARLSGRVALGYASHVAREASIEDSVIMPEAWIGPGARLTRSIVGQGVELPAGFVAERVAICCDVDRSRALPAPITRHDGLLVRPLDAPRAGS